MSRPEPRPSQQPLPGTPESSGGPDAGWEHETLAWRGGYRVVAGIDEVGRGALAGPVFAAAVVFPPGTALEGLRDSKLLSPRRRAALSVTIRATALAVQVARVEAEDVDRWNVLEATLHAMRNAVMKLAPGADLLLLDAVRLPGAEVPQRQLVKGDRLCASIAAASVIAKVERDHAMVEFDRTYPYYGFGRHKGYGTREHFEALESRGPSPIHRRTFLRMERGDRGPSLF